MPLHIDIKINEKTIQRIHIARMTKNGMKPDSINEYAVVKGEETLYYDEDLGRLQRGVPKEPDWLDWENSTVRFNHRYGDSAQTCLLKALETMEAAEKDML